MTIRKRAAAGGVTLGPGFQGSNMFLVVCLITTAAVLVVVLVWHRGRPGGELFLPALLVNGDNRMGRGELQGVLSVRHQWRMAHNRNSDIYTDTLTVTINHRDRNNLDSSES